MFRSSQNKLPKRKNVRKWCSISASALMKWLHWWGNYLNNGCGSLIDSFSLLSVLILDLSLSASLWHPPSSSFSIVRVQFLLSLPWCPPQHREEVAFALPSLGTIDACPPSQIWDMSYMAVMTWLKWQTRHLKIKKCRFTGNDAQQHLYNTIVLKNCVMHIT